MDENESGIISTIREIAKKEKSKAIRRGDYIGALAVAYVEEALREER